MGALFLSQILACYLMVSTQNAFNTALSRSGGICGSAVIFIFPGVMSTLISHKVAEKGAGPHPGKIDHVAKEPGFINKTFYFSLSRVRGHDENLTM